MRFRPLSDQVILLTGATSRIDLATARKTAKAGSVYFSSREASKTARSSRETCRLFFETNYWGLLNGVKHVAASGDAR